MKIIISNRKFDELAEAGIDFDTAQQLESEGTPSYVGFTFYNWDDHNGDDFQEGFSSGAEFVSAAVNEGYQIIVSTGGEGWHLYIAGNSEKDCIEKLSDLVGDVED